MRGFLVVRGGRGSIDRGPVQTQVRTCALGGGTAMFPVRRGSTCSRTWRDMLGRGAAVA